MKLKKISANETLLYNDNLKLLFSYDTPVAAWTPTAGFVRTELFHSNTTSRHINRFIGSAEFKKVPQAHLDDLQAHWGGV